MKRAALIFAALAAILTAPAAPVRTATENFVTNKIAEAVAAIPSPDYSTNNTELVETIEAKAPTPDLSPFLRSDKSDNEVQIFGGFLSGFGFHADTGHNDNGWNQYTAHNGTSLSQSLPSYITSNPWGFLKQGEAIPTTGGVYTAMENLHFNRLSVGVWPSGYRPIDISGGSGAAFTFGDGVQAKRSNTMALGTAALNTNEWSFIWNGDANRYYIPSYPSMSNPYATRYNGGFHVNPSVRSGMVNPLQNFWIGDTNLNDWIVTLSPPATWATLSGKPTNVSAFENDAGYLTGYTESDPTVPSWAKAASKPTYTADEVGAVSSNKIEEVRQDNAQTRQIVTTWENFLDGSNVVFSITNYLSGSYNLDTAKLRILELRDGEYHEVYNSRDEILLHIDDFSNRYVRVALDAIVDEVAARLASKADKDWGKYTSAGGEAPSNTVYMTAPNTVFAGGLEYERVAVGEGTICVLTTRGAPVWTQGDEGTFKFQDDGGTNYFGFAKTDSYTIGANTDGITVQGSMVTLNYNITMSGRPCVWYKSSLSSGAWEQLNLPDGSPVAGASHAVTWEANPDPGTQVCYINVGSQPSGFFKATVEVAGSAKFMTNMPADMSGGIFCTDGVYKVRPVYNNGSVTWEVFQ